MKYNLALLAILFLTNLSAQNSTPNYFVSDLKSIDEIKLNLSQLNTLAKEYGQTANFAELKVQKEADHYVLLAKDIAQKWIYAFELANIDSKLYIDIDKHINACISETLSLSIFNIKDNVIDGCIKAEHRVLGRN